MTTPLSANQALVIVNQCSFPLPVPLIGCTVNREFMLVLPETHRQAALKLSEKLTQRLQAPARGRLDGRHLATNYGVTAWRRNDNAGSLLQRAAMALSQARAEHSGQSLML